MDKKEFATFVAALRTYYPREAILPNQQAAELWYMELQDLSYNVAMMALREHVHTSKWSPSISELRERAANYRELGWRFVEQIGNLYAVYRCDDPEAPELYTDPESFGWAMKKLIRRQWLGAAAVLLWACWLLLWLPVWPASAAVSPWPPALLPLSLPPARTPRASVSP